MGIQGGLLIVSQYNMIRGRSGRSEEISNFVFNSLSYHTG